MIEQVAVILWTSFRVFFVVYFLLALIAPLIFILERRFTKRFLNRRSFLEPYIGREIPQRFPYNVYSYLIHRGQPYQVLDDGHVILGCSPHVFDICPIITCSSIRSLFMGSTTCYSRKSYIAEVKRKHPKLGLIISMQQEWDGDPDMYSTIFGLKFLHLPTVDHIEPSLKFLEMGVEAMLNVRKAGGTTYAHCKGGRGRAAAVVFCYLMVLEAEQKGFCNVNLKKLNLKLGEQKRVRHGLWKQENILAFYNHHSKLELLAADDKSIKEEDACSVDGAEYPGESVEDQPPSPPPYPEPHPEPTLRKR